MKIKAYISIGQTQKGTCRLRISKKKNFMPIMTGSRYYGSILPTISFPVEFNLPDDIFDNDPITKITPKIAQIKGTSKKLAKRIEKVVQKEVLEFKTDQLVR